MRRIRDCYNDRLGRICDKALELKTLSVQVHDLLPLHLRPECQVQSFAKGILHLQVKNAVWATELRYGLPELRDKLRQEKGLYQLVSIKLASATEPLEIFKKRKEPLLLSEKAKKAIAETAERCAYEPLREAMRELLR